MAVREIERSELINALPLELVKPKNQLQLQLQLQFLGEGINLG